MFTLVCVPKSLVTKGDEEGQKTCRKRLNEEPDKVVGKISIASLPENMPKRNPTGKGGEIVRVWEARGSMCEFQQIY